MRRALSALEAVWTPLWLCLGLLVVMVGLGHFGATIQNYVLQGLVSIIIVVGLYVFVGNSGIISLGHIGLMAVGAYVGGILSIPPDQRQAVLPTLPSFLSGTELTLWVAVALGAVIAAVLAFVISIPIARLNDALAVAIATLALLAAVQVVLTNWNVVSDGGQATPGIPTDATQWSAYLGVVIAVAVAWAYQRSSRGFRLRASREDVVAAKSVGVNVAWERRWAFALSGGIVGFGGGLYAHVIGVVSPDDFYLTTTILTLAALVIGGISSLSGAVVGSVVLTALNDFFTQFVNDGGIGPIHVTLPNGVTTAIIAAVMIAILIKRPRGITAGREIPFPKRLRAMTVAPALVEVVPARTAVPEAVPAPTPDVRSVR